MRIHPSETEIAGDRIEQLTRDYLVLIGRDESGWDTFYQDPGDGRFWVLIYPDSHLHGGGLPILKSATREEAEKSIRP